MFRLGRHRSDDVWAGRLSIVHGVDEDLVAVDACGNSSLPFVQTIKEASDLMLTGTTSTDVTCNPAVQTEPPH